MSDRCLRCPPPRTPCTTEETLISSLLLDPTSLLKNLVEARYNTTFTRHRRRTQRQQRGGNLSRKSQYSPSQSKSKNYSFVKLIHQILKMLKFVLTLRCGYCKVHISKSEHFIWTMAKVKYPKRVVGKGTYSNAKVNLFLRD